MPLLVNERNVRKSGEEGASEAEREGGYLGGQKHSGTNFSVERSVFKDLCKSGATENDV